MDTVWSASTQRTLGLRDKGNHRLRRQAGSKDLDGMAVGVKDLAIGRRGQLPGKTRRVCHVVLENNQVTVGQHTGARAWRTRLCPENHWPGKAQHKRQQRGPAYLSSHFFNQFFARRISLILIAKAFQAIS